MNNKLNKTIYLGLVAQRVLTKQEYKRLTAKATKGYKGNVPQYDKDKLYNLFINEEKIKHYIDEFENINTLLAENKFAEAAKIIDDKIKEKK